MRNTGGSSTDMKCGDTALNVSPGRLFETVFYYNNKSEKMRI